jgi:hypothetical protein
MKRTASIRAITQCVLYSLSQSDLQVILEINPEMSTRMREIAEERLRLNQATLCIQKVAPNANLVQFVDNSFGHKSVPQAPVSNSLTIEKAIEAARRNSFIAPLINHEVIAQSIIVEPTIVGKLESLPLGIQENPSDGKVTVSHGTPFAHDNKKSSSQGSLEKMAMADEVLSDMDSKDIMELVQTSRRKSSVMHFVGKSFLDQHVTADPQKPGIENVVVDSNGQQEPIELHRKKRGSKIESHIPAPIHEGALSSLSETQELQAANLDAVEQTEEIFLVPGQPMPLTVSRNGSSSRLEKSLASLNHLSKVDGENSKNRSQANLEVPSHAESKSSVHKSVNQSIKASRELQESGEPAGEVKINIKDGKEDEDELDDDVPKRVVTRKQVKQETNETPALTKNFDDFDRNDSFGRRMAKLWNKYQPSSKYAPLHPNMPISRIWNSIFQIAFLFVAILLPLPFGFQSLRGMLPGLSIFVFLITFLDLLIKLQTGYAQFEEVEMEPAKLIRIYLRNGTFAFDFVTGFPWVFIIDAATSQSLATQDAARLFCLVHGLPFFKSLLSSRRSYVSEQITEYIRKYDINVSAVQAFKILFAIIFYWHWHSCSANYIMRMGFVPNPYPELMNFGAYTLHFWTSATEMLNAGCGAVPPIVTLDRWLKVVNMICNCTLVALFVGNISSFMIGLDSSGRQFNEQLEQVSQYINYKGLGRELKKKILDYYQLKYSKGKYFDESKILAELNHPLRLVYLTHVGHLHARVSRAHYTSAILQRGRQRIHFSGGDDSEACTFLARRFSHRERNSR